MTITANYAYLSPEVAEFVEEAFERGADMAPSAIGQEHIASALRSIRFLLSEWNTYGVREWMVVRVSQTLTTADTDFDVAQVGVIDVLNAVLRRDGRDTPMYGMGRKEWLEIPDKTVQGRPSRFFADKQYDRVTVNLWQAPPNSTDIMIMDCLRQVSSAGTMANTLQLPPTAYECFVAGLAMKLAQKFNFKKYESMRVDYGGREYPQKLGGKVLHMLSSTADTSDLRLRIRR